MRSIISSFIFDKQVEDLGGAKAIDEALSPFIESLMNNPYEFPMFENDFTSFRWVRTKETTFTPPLVIVFIIDEDKNVVLEHVEALP